MNSGSKRSWSAVAATDEVVDYNAVQQGAELYSPSASEGDHVREHERRKRSIPVKLHHEKEEERRFDQATHAAPYRDDASEWRAAAARRLRGETSSNPTLYSVVSRPSPKRSRSGNDGVPADLQAEASDSATSAAASDVATDFEPKPKPMDPLIHEMGMQRSRNEELLREREAFIKRIKDLEAAMQHGAAGTLALDDVRENTKLREEVMAHRQFLHAFLKMVKGSPTEEQSRRQIYDEGAESAKTMILGILADSQHKEWESVKLPSELRRLGHSFEMHYKLADRLFTSGSHSAEESTQRSQKRLQLRVDYSLEGISTQEVADRVTAVLCAPKGKDRFVRLASNSRERVELRPLPNGDTGEDTMFLHHRKRYPPPQKDRDAVFLFHRCKTKMARSTLAPPPKLVRKPAQDTPGGYVYERPQLCQPRKRGRPLGSKANKNKPWAFGQADVNILARMSTSLVVGASQSEDAQRITSPILHGAFVFTEETLAEEDGEAVSAPRVRLVFIMSTPPEFSEEEEFGSIEAILRPDGSLTKNFAKYIHVFGQNIGASRPTGAPHAS